MISPPIRFALVRVLFALVLLGATAFGDGKGVIIYKDQPWLADEFALAVEYEQLEEYPNIFNLTTAANETLSIQTGKIVKSIRYLDRDSIGELIEPRDLARVSSAISDLSAAARQYPKSSKLLEPHIRQLQEIADRFHKGEVISGGAWLPSKEAALKLKKERQAAIAAADAEDQRKTEATRLAKEKFAAELRSKILEQQEYLEKETLRKQEEARAAEEQRKLLEESQATEARRKEEQQRATAEKQALDEAHIEYASKKMQQADRFTEDFDLPLSAITFLVAKLPEEAGDQSAKERAISAAQTIVRKQLKTPMTARFQEARILQESDPWYQVFIAVDARNAFGIYSRGTYVCTLKLGPGNEFTYEQTLGAQKMDEEAMNRAGALGEIRSACGWNAPAAPDRH
jgi:hypothetical protein